MPAGYPVCTEHGMKIETPTRFSMGERGYIFNTTAPIPSSLRMMRLPFTGDESPIKVMKNFDSVSPVPHINGNKIVTGARRNSPSVSRGAFKNGNFVSFANQSVFVYDGVFLHTYTENGETKTRLVGVQSDGNLRDCDTGVLLTRGGDTVQGGSGAPSTDLTYTISPDGRAMIIEFMLWPSWTRNSFRYDIDYLGSPQIVATKLNDTTPYGTTTTFSSQTQNTTGTAGDYMMDLDNFSSNHRQASYPLARGLDALGNTRQITITEDFFFSTDRDGMQSFDGADFTKASIVTFVNNRRATVSLPGGVSKEFVIDSLNRVVDQNFVFDQAAPLYTTTLSETATHVRGALAFIWCDPTIPCVIYEYNKIEMTETGSGSRSDSTQDTGWSVPCSGSYTATREIGILIGDVARVLFTETHTGSGTAPTVIVLGGFPNMPFGSFGVDQVLLDYPQNNTFSNGPNVTNITTNNGWTKKLKWLTDPVASNSINGDGNLLMVDVQSLTGSNLNKNRYFVDVKNISEWVFAMIRVRSISGSVIPIDFRWFSGNLDEAKLKQRYIDYLIAAELQEVTPDQSFIAALQAGTFTNECRPDSKSRMSMR